MRVHECNRINQDELGMTFYYVVQKLSVLWSDLVGFDPFQSNVIGLSLGKNVNTLNLHLSQDNTMITKNNQIHY